MHRRAFVQLAAAAVVLSPFELAFGETEAALPETSLSTLRALAPVVLPASLGRRAIALWTDRFLVRLQQHRADVPMDGGYGRAVLRRTPESPAPRYIEQLAALEKAAESQGQVFGRMTADTKRALIEDALRNAHVEQLPEIPNGQHIVSDLMAFYFRSSDANDECYRAQIGRETCRPLAAVTRRPRPLA